MRGWLVGCGAALTLLGCGGAGRNAADAASIDGKDPSVRAQCSAFLPPTEPELLAWDAGARASLKRLYSEGVVAVRYEADGCDVKLELLPHCTAAAKYAYAPLRGNEQTIALTASELHEMLPLGGSSLAGALQDGRALRADAMLVGRHALPPGMIVTRSTLKGADCSRATHVMSAAYVGGFALARGEARSLEAASSVFATTVAGAETFTKEGDAVACERARQDGAASAQCDAPLRIRLLPITESSPRPVAGVRAAGSMVKIPRSVLSDGFWLDQTEVTVAAYSACVKSGACQAPRTEDADAHCNWGKDSKKQHPINCVSWTEADAYCKTMGKRLPTEKEWEFAASGGDRRAFPWGDNVPESNQVCWAKEDGTCAVGLFPAGASRHGVLDMAGDVWEWTSSHTDDNIYANRGGAWLYSVASYVEVSSRSGYSASYRDNSLGFRCAK